MSRFSKFSSLRIASIIVAVGLLVCLLPMPYGYYTIVRLAMAILAACWAYRFATAKRTVLAVITIGVVIIFQPLIKVVMDRATWNVIDVILAAALLLLVFMKKKK